MATEEQINLVLTREQRYKRNCWGKFFLSREILFSKAFWALTSPSAIRVYLIFLNKCRVEKEKLPGRKEKTWTIKNNGNIEFPYDEAESYSICRKTFSKVIDQLIGVGFIDLVWQGSGLQKDKSKYAISDRWKKYGTPDFVEAKRTKRTTHQGFTKGNSFAAELWRKNHKIPIVHLNKCRIVYLSKCKDIHLSVKSSSVGT